MNSNSPEILLASSSTYRRDLLNRILPTFKTDSPNINETKLNNESLKTMAGRLALEKAVALSDKYPNHLIIGSDQVACLSTNGIETQLKKPYTREVCFEQLKRCQGKSVQFFTGLCLLNSKTMSVQTSIETYTTKFRTLSDEQLWHYIEREPALDCAGGFKMEGLGVALFEKFIGDDPNTLVGLPLIKLINMLKQEGLEIL